jgi:hypothetical protein
MDQVKNIIIAKDVLKKARQSYKKTTNSKNPKSKIFERDPTLFIQIMDEKHAKRMEQAPLDLPPRPPANWA